MSYVKKTSLALLLCAFLTLYAAPALAQLLISPVRVVFEDRSRSQTVSLINTSDTTRTYRIEFFDTQMGADGMYENITRSGNIPEGFVSASDFLRYSPRQVTLGPRESQQIRIAVRKPEGLPTGEYRTHMILKQLAQLDDVQSSVDRVTTAIRANISFSIPIIVRHGQLEAQAKIADIRYGTNEDGEEGLFVKVTRTGHSSTYGSLVAYNPNQRIAEEAVGVLNNFAVFTEASERNTFVRFREPVSSGQQLIITYEGREDAEGRLYDETTYTIP